MRSTRNESGPSAITLTNVTKRFGDLVALDEVSIDVEEGAVVGLIGENGAGKSTLLNILSGIVHADAGAITVHGGPYRPSSYAAAMQAGVFRVYQEAAFISCLSLCENLTLGFERHFSRYGFLSRRRQRATAATAFP